MTAMRLQGAAEIEALLLKALAKSKLKFPDFSEDA